MTIIFIWKFKASMKKSVKAYDYDVNYYREDNYFWRKIKAPNLEIVAFDLQYPADLNINKIDVKVSLFGLTYSDTEMLMITMQLLDLIKVLLIQKCGLDRTEQIFDQF